MGCVNSVFGAYPANYGARCGVHLEPQMPGCFNVALGKPWPAPCKSNLSSGCRQDWCDMPWCYVDPCNCDHSSIDLTGSAYFRGAHLYYSYKNCEGLGKEFNMGEKRKLNRTDCRSYDVQVSEAKVASTCKL